MEKDGGDGAKGRRVEGSRGKVTNYLFHKPSKGVREKQEVVS
jgi:hypothetical protein